MRYLLLSPLLLLALLAGCAKTTVTTPAVHSSPASTDAQPTTPPPSELDFWHTLAQQPVVRNDDALYALLLHFDGRVEEETYDQRVARMKQRKLLPESFDHPADESVMRGTVAVAVCNKLYLQGGLMRWLLPRSPRYATRELTYRGMYPLTGPHQPMSGEQFLGVLGSAEDYQRYRSVRAANRKPVAPATPSQENKS